MGDRQTWAALDSNTLHLAFGITWNRDSHCHNQVSLKLASWWLGSVYLILPNSLNVRFLLVIIIMDYRARGSWIGNARACYSECMACRHAFDAQRVTCGTGSSAMLNDRSTDVLQRRNCGIDEALNRSIWYETKCQDVFEWVLACTWSKQTQSSNFTAIVPHFCTHISDSCIARARIPAPSVRAEDSLRPLVDYKYNSVWDGVGIISYRYKIRECSM